MRKIQVRYVSVRILIVNCHLQLCLLFQGLPNDYGSLTSYTCRQCAPGCETCIDSSPCILSLNWLQRSVVLGVSCLFMGFIPILIWFTYRYRDVKVSLNCHVKNFLLFTIPMDYSTDICIKTC